jgi:uncharacterized iron-regulated membrane protein
MPFLSTFLHHPRRLFLRRALFQIHLWLGVLLSLYVALIGLSGSVLVFEDELRAISMRDLQAVNLGHLAPPQAVLANAHRFFPRETVTYLLWPSGTTPAFTIYLNNAKLGSHTVLANATSGQLLRDRPRLFIDTVHDFHVYLLAGQTGFVVNCAAGIGLLVLAITGVFLWWPGLRLWFRGFRINLRGNWKRINYDSHNLVGVLTLAIVSWWGLTAIDFLWPAQTTAVVNVISPVRGMKEPQLPIPNATGGSTLPGIGSSDPQAAILTQIHTLNPRGSLSGISLPASPSGNIIAYVDTAAPGDFSHRDIHTFSASTGQLLTTWHYGQNHTVGDWILWLVYPLHFGTLWGLPVKILWCVLGLSLPVLAITGLLMYWNRYLSKRWARLHRQT